jgi:hypothetical protein
MEYDEHMIACSIHRPQGERAAYGRFVGQQCRVRCEAVVELGLIIFVNIEIIF